jgi:phosphoribosylformylglycinamidine synthase
MRAIQRAGMEPVFCRWNGDIAVLESMDGYLIPGGFSYEDRGRAGMIPARDPVMDILRQQASAGKPVIGICNGAQVLVESGLIPNASGLQMSLARNSNEGERVGGFLSEWVWITPTCAKERCATSDWEGPMHLPIAHGEGRFTTSDTTLWKTLMDNDQLAFCYCDAEGNVAPTGKENPNGSEFGAAGICNPAGNVVALMPHPERSPHGQPYFDALKQWIDRTPRTPYSAPANLSTTREIATQSRPAAEIFIDTIIVNNEERSVEQAAKRILSGLRLKQLKYIALSNDDPTAVLSQLSIYNSNKEIAYIRRGDTMHRWNAQTKTEEATKTSPLSNGVPLVRFDGEERHSGVCYVCMDVTEAELLRSDVQEVFGNPHASTLVRLS